MHKFKIILEKLFPVVTFANIVIVCVFIFFYIKVQCFSKKEIVSQNFQVEKCKLGMGVNDNFVYFHATAGNVKIMTPNDVDEGFIARQGDINIITYSAAVAKYRNYNFIVTAKHVLKNCIYRNQFLYSCDVGREGDIAVCLINPDCFEKLDGYLKAKFLEFNPLPTQENVTMRGVNMYGEYVSVNAPISFTKNENVFSCFLGSKIDSDEKSVRLMRGLSGTPVVQSGKMIGVSSCSFSEEAWFVGGPALRELLDEAIKLHEAQ